MGLSGAKARRGLPGAGSVSTTSIPVGLDDVCESAVQELGVGFNDVDVSAHVDRVIVAVEAEAGLPGDLRAVLAEMMRAGDDSLFEAFANLEEAGYEKCSRLRGLLAGDPEPRPPDEDEVRAALAKARALWDAAGLDDYTLTVSFEGDFPPGGDVVAEAEAQRAIWEMAGIDGYQLTISTQCFCPPGFRAPYTVTVAGPG